MNKIFAFLLLIFITQSVFADLQCNVNTPKFYALYKANEYTCSSGEFLPANTLGCESCPNGYTCNGGTFKFNANNFQGINMGNISSTTINNVCAYNFPQKLVAYYTRNKHTCTPGYYLPANIDECTICPNDNLCIGGTYTFDENENQGITPCPVGTYSPKGSDSICYPHILHIGENNIYLKSEKQTIPSLNIGLNGEIFYANMTTTPTYMNKDSEHYLHINYDNKDYYVCDDTTYAE